jgi:hypothetical protein
MATAPISAGRPSAVNILVLGLNFPSEQIEQLLWGQAHLSQNGTERARRQISPMQGNDRLAGGIALVPQKSNASP